MSDENKNEINLESGIKNKKKTIKKMSVILMILIVGLIVVFALPFLWFVGMVLYNMFIDIPSKPKVEHGEFSFRLVYEYKGEQVTITDTIVCDYDGYSFSLEGIIE